MNDLNKLPPLIVTLQELEAILLPVTMGYAWGVDTIHDLWKIGAPMPNDNSRRIVFPKKLAEWLADVLQRQGRPLDDMARVYLQLRSMS
jgi:hypothetical protein